MSRRLAASEETRQRITAATFELHATIGPSRTTVSAIADRAGVQRHTVYAHFPDLDALYAACTEHGMRVTGMPAAGPWSAIEHPEDRLAVGLGDLYGWYASNEPMLANVLYDIDPTAPKPTEPDLFELRMADLHAALAHGWIDADDVDGRRAAVGTVIGHAMGFETWRSLTSSGFSNVQAIGLLVAVVRGVADGSITIPPMDGSLGQPGSIAPT
jgi:AcrR family transcriptional regulator